MLVLGLPTAQAAEVVAAVAANFASVMARLEPAFEQTSGHRLTVVLGSSGQLTQQIAHGAPFDVLLAADARYPAWLAEQSLGVPATRYTYALGRLTLWSADPSAITSDGPAYLRAGAFKHLAIANPAVAPYGAAAQQTLQRLGLWAGLQNRLVRGQDVGQVYAMVASGAAQCGFVARSAVLAGARPGSRWDVDPGLHEPLRQDAILLTRAREAPAAYALLAFLKTPAARALIAAGGYDLP